MSGKEVKAEPSVPRTFDDDGYRRRAATVCVRGRDEKVLLVTRLGATDNWTLPGGGIDPNEAPVHAAVREAEEEAGIQGKLERFLGIFENNDKMHRTFVFVLNVIRELDYWQDNKKGMGRARKWFSFADAKQAMGASRPLQTCALTLAEQGSIPPHLFIAPASDPVGTSCDDQNSVTHHDACADDHGHGKLRDGISLDRHTQDLSQPNILDSLMSGMCHATPRQYIVCSLENGELKKGCSSSPIPISSLKLS